MNEDKITAIYVQRQLLREKRAPLLQQVEEIGSQIAALEREADLLRYPCKCVRVNKDLDIYDTGEQEAKNRHGLTLGSVYNALSADENCPICHGSGVPQ